MIDKMKPILVEVVLFGAIIFLLSAWAFSRNNMWKDEIGLCVDCVKKSPKKARPYIQLGFAYFNAGAYDRSLEAAQRAIQLDPKHGEAYYILGLAYKQTGDAPKAIEMEKKALEVDRSLSLAYYTLGQIYFETGQYEESEKAFQKFLGIFPNIPEVHNLLAVVYMAQRKFDKAVIELEREIKISPSYALADLNLGQVYRYEFRKRQKAIDPLKTALILPNRGEIRKLVRLLEGLP